MGRMRKHFLWLLKKDESDLDTIELQHEYNNPQEALDDIARGVDKRENRSVPPVRSDRPEDSSNVGRFLNWKDRGK